MGTMNIQNSAPTSPSANDIWANTAIEPLNAYYYSGSAWVAFNNVPIVSITVESGSITASCSLRYNNGVKKTVIETYQNGNNWYRVWSDGWCEQGGQVRNAPGGDGTITKTDFIKPFKDTNYFVNKVVVSSSGAQYNTSYVAIYEKAASYFKSFTTTTAGANNFDWEAKGYIF